MNAKATVSAEEAGTLRDEIERLKSDLHRLRTDFSGLTDDAVHAARTGAAQAKDRVEQGARAVADKGQESVEALENQIAAHPLMALAAAFSVGMALGIGLSRKA